MNTIEFNPYIGKQNNVIQDKKMSVIFSTKDHPGTLASVLNMARELTLNMSRIESRPSTNKSWDCDFFVEFNNPPDGSIEALSKKLLETKTGQISLVTQVKGISWFPRKLRDLDLYAQKSLEYSDELATDHPGFTDAVYKERRKVIVQIAKSYKAGHPIPQVEYTDSEKATWKAVYTKLTQLYPTHACIATNKFLPLLEINCGYSPDCPPQLQNVSDFLHDLTGWRLRPVMGLLTSREFLNAFAFRVFHSTQYIRHPSQPMYTPEPDMCHDLIGHVPLFSDLEFAEFSQEIGLASLGVSDQDIERLSTLYWFTVEFGICKESTGMRAYGAGLLSSFGELEYCLGGGTEKPEYHPFDPSKASSTKYPITKYQPLYFVTDSFESAKEQVRAFARTLDRPFSVRYNPLTENIDILDRKESLILLSHSIQRDLKTLTEALDKIL